MLPSLPSARSMIRVKPDATTSGVPPPGGIRNTLAAPGTNGKPVSCPTYSEPSGARTTDVGTGSTGIIVPGGGGGAPGIAGAGALPNGRSATSEIVPYLTDRMSLPPASATTIGLAVASTEFGLDSTSEPGSAASGLFATS